MMGFLKTDPIHFWRRVAQTATAVLFILLPLLNARGFQFVWGNFLTIHIGSLTFSDPLAILQVVVGSRIIPPKIFLETGLVLGIAFFLGTIFCSWICPFGLLSELTHTLARRFKPGRIDINLFKSGPAAKLILFCCGVAAVFLFFQAPILNQASLPFQYSNIFQYLFIQSYLVGAAWILMAILFVEFVFCRRLWCRWVCPQSVLIALAGQCNPFVLKVRFHPKRCLFAKDSPPCQTACSLDLDPRRLNGTNRFQCTNCGDCIDACRKKGNALDFGFKATEKE
ncbi:4Fe-4S binding protein [uncultured Desulfosarcina sp.]|uniref:4Fe-4S binding protein n=1 Tax=uncultured Desulfosarcina sp. TaxID=218289 RepID=UPI0029C97CD5|nr:4Fe-4S binding protein [uncultured Desulfosarcina sp.]